MDQGQRQTGTGAPPRWGYLRENDNLTDSSLSSRINKSFDWVTIDFDIYVKHCYSAKGLWREFHGVLHVFQHLLLSYGFLYLFLSFNIERIRHEKLFHLMFLSLHCCVSFSPCVVQFLELGRVIPSGICDFWFALFQLSHKIWVLKYLSSSVFGCTVD